MVGPGRLDGEEFSIPVYSEVCTYCRHLRNYGEGRICEAFPDGIPMPIWMGENRHLDPYPGDHGIQFELRPGMKNPPDWARTTS